MNMPAQRLLATAVFGALAVSGARAQFAEGFDLQVIADVTIQNEPDTIVTFVDYSNMTVGSTNFSIPEAPRPVAGSLPTRGLLVQCKVTQGAAAAVNVVAGATPISFSGRYRLSFDAWINVPLPVPGGSTEQLLWGVGVDDFAPIEARHNRGGGTVGVWGWLAGENGYSSEDAVINEGDVPQGVLGDLVAGQGVPFNEAFDSNAIGGPNGCAANTWVRVDIDVDANGTRVFYNGAQFFDVPNVPLPGFAMIGYEDPFASLGSQPDGQWCLLDNFRVTDIGNLADSLSITVAPTLVGFPTLTPVTMSAEDDGGAEVLSVQPSYAMQVEDDWGVVEHVYDGGYTATVARQSVGRRQWSFHWDALNASETAAIGALRLAVEGTKSAFSWTDPTTSETIHISFVEGPRLSLVAPGTYQAEALVREVLANA